MSHVPTSPDSPVTGAAGRWFAIQVSYARFTGWRKVTWAIRWLISFAVSLGFSTDEFQHPGTIRVVRRRDGLVVTEIDHSLPSELEAHVVSLRERLVGEDVDDFCRDLGIPPEHVADAGEDFAENDLVSRIS